MLLVDAREPKPIIAAIQKEAKKRNIQTEVKLLDCGDFVWMDEGICIERKAIADFAQSVNEGRLKHQLLRMQGYPHPYVFISGPIEDIVIYSNKKPWVWTLTHHDGSKVSICAKYNVKVLQFANDMKLIDAVFTIKEKFDEFQKDGVGYALIKQIKKSDVINPNYVMYMSIPGIGKKSAIDLMIKYPCFYDFFRSYADGILPVKLKKSSIEFLDKLIWAQE